MPLFQCGTANILVVFPELSSRKSSCLPSLSIRNTACRLCPPPCTNHIVSELSVYNTIKVLEKRNPFTFELPLLAHLCWLPTFYPSLETPGTRLADCWLKHSRHSPGAPLSIDHKSHSLSLSVSKFHFL